MTLPKNRLFSATSKLDGVGQDRPGNTDLIRKALRRDLTQLIFCFDLPNFVLTGRFHAVQKRPTQQLKWKVAWYALEALRFNLFLASPKWFPKCAWIYLFIGTAYLVRSGHFLHKIGFLYYQGNRNVGNFLTNINCSFAIIKLFHMNNKMYFCFAFHQSFIRISKHK